MHKITKLNLLINYIDYLFILLNLRGVFLSLLGN
jgi:hypothetical protein